MRFGLPNAPASFYGYINKILAEKLDIFIIVYLDNILIYNEDPGQPHVEAVRWVLEHLRKHGLFANLKKCRFHQDEVRFLGFVVSAYGIRNEEERIKAVKTWPEPKSVRDMRVFLDFANFYGRFIKNFSRIATPLTSMLRTTSELSDARSLRIKANDNNYNQKVGGGGGGAGAAGRKVKNLSESEKSKISAKSKKSAKAKKPNTDFAKSKANEAFGTDFLTCEARAVFIRLQKAFTEVPILHHSDPEPHIWIETNASGYAIGGVLSQLTSDLSYSNHVISENPNPDPKFFKSEIGQWHPVAFFSRKMILAETRYETHDQELLAIVEAFKTWRHYLKDCKYEDFVLTDHNNLRRFMGTKSLSSRQVRWAQKLSRYHFRIDY